MERLGLEDDMAIESRIVSKTIESAQSRVEGYNFDMRKRVVEFDDVINRQRETIYAERDKVLRNEDLTDSVRDFVDEEIDGLVDEFLMGDNVDDWNMGGLAEALAAMGLDDKRLTEDALWEAGDRESIGAHIFEVADEALADREERYGEEGWSLAERVVLLRTIDSLWVEHLTELDDMRRGIGLRGYAQQDPLNEFRKEAFRLYGELRGFIRHGVASAIFRVTVNVTPTDGDGHTHGDGPRPLAGGPYRAPRPLPTPAAGSGTGDGGGTPAGVAAAGAAGAAGAANPAGTKLGRNDPCWCGSGQKYKRCHGR
jgi:preprotein translocase subunit SecA